MYVGVRVYVTVGDSGRPADISPSSGEILFDA